MEPPVLTTQEIVPSQAERLILIFAFDGATLLDIVGPAEVFDVAARYVPGDNQMIHRVEIVSPKGGAVRASSGISIATNRARQYRDMAIDTIFVTGGGPPDEPPVPDDVVRCIQEMAPRARRICAICTGTFILAAAGLAANRRVTTHWRAADLLAQRYPDTIVDADPIFVKDGPIWSSAGFTAGIDMALALYEEDHGHLQTLKLAQLLVLFLKRPGSQSQISLPLANQSRPSNIFGDLHAWLRSNIHRRLTVEDIAIHVGMTPRTFARRYVSTVGKTPAQTMMEFRLEAAQDLLMETDLPLKDIARVVGLGDEQNLRRTCQRLSGMTPAQFRSHAKRPHANTKLASCAT